MNKAIKFLIKKAGSAVLQGQSIMNISLPVMIFDKRSLLQVFAYEMRGAPFFLQKAFYSKEPIQRLKWIMSFFLSQLSISTIQAKPFSPIIGETYQSKIGDLNIYIEQTVSKPPTYNFYCFDDNARYKYYGYVATTASTGANSVKAKKLGKVCLDFSDGTKYQLYYPQVSVKGTTMGTKTFNYKHSLAVAD